MQIAEDSGEHTGTLLTGTSSVDGPVTVQSFSIAGETGTFTLGSAYVISGVGSLTINSNGSYSFTPDANWNGDVPQISYTLSDGSSTNDSTLDIEVTAQDDSFTDANETVQIAEDSGEHTGTLLTGTSSVDGPVTVQSFSIAGETGTFTLGSAYVISGVGSLTINSNGSYSFTPDANWNGDVPQISYTLSDGSSTNDSTLDIEVTAQDDSFTDANETVQIAEDSGEHTGTLLTGTSSVDGPVTVQSFSIAGETGTFTLGSAYVISGVGSLTINSNGSYSFTPDANWNGDVPQISYTLSDGSSTNDSTLDIEVTAQDDSFTDANETVQIAEDSGEHTGTLLTGTSSVDGPVTVQSFSIAGETGTFTLGSAYVISGVGSLTINSNGSYSFTPDANWNGDVPQISYTLSDGSSTNDSTLDIEVTAQDDSFTDANETVQIAEDSGEHTGTLLTGTSSVDGPVTVQSFSIAGETGTFTLGSAYVISGVGSLTINSNGSYSFTPDANWNGDVPQISYTLSDGSSTNDSTLDIEVTAQDDSFTDANETVQIAEDSGEHTGTLLTGTSSVDGPVTVQSFSIAGETGTFTLGSAYVISGVGSLTINSNGSYSFTPDANWNGDVPQISYTLSDGSSTNDSTLDIEVTAQDDSFTDANETVQIAEDSGEHTGTLLTGTSSVDGPVTVQSFSIAGETGTFTLGSAYVISGVGSLTINSNGSYSFTPDANWNGDVPQISYTLSDGSSTNDSTLDIEVTAQDDSFTDANETVQIAEDSGEHTGTLLTGTSSVDGPVTVQSFSIAGETGTFTLGSAYVISGVGSLTINSNGSYSFTPDANWNGDVPQISYTLSDGSSTNDSTLDIEVTAQDDSFTDANETVQIAEDSGEHTGTLLTGTSSVDGPVTVQSFSIAGETGTFTLGSAYVISGVGSLTINSNGSYSFTPDANWNGDVPQISYTLSDGSSTNDSTLDIEVTAQDDSFTDANETVQIAEDSGEHTGTLLTGTSSVDGPVTVQSFSIAGETGTFTLGSAYVISGVGSLTINSNGSYSFTPDANWNGDVPQISYTLSDGSSTNDSTLDIEVTAQDDSFTDANETVQIAEDSGEHTGTLLTGTSSVDGPVTVQSFSIAGETGTFTLGSAYVISGVGSLTINSNGSYSFTPDANWNGDVPQISYTLSDGSSTNDSTLDIEVTAQDDSFTDANETVQIAEDSGEHTGTLLTGTSSVDGPVTVQSFSIAGETGTFTLGSAYVISGVGSLTINSNGSYSFTPDANWNGDVPQISYTLSDGSSTNDSTLDIEVTAQDDSFTDANETVQIAEDSGEHTGTLLTGTSSVDGPVTVQSFSIAGETGTFTLGSAYVISGVGSLTINSNGSYSFTPDANWNGDVPQISYTLSDGSSTNDSTLDIEVTAQDDSFTDANETVQIAEDSGEHTGTLLTGTSSVDGPVTVQSFSIAGETGTFTLGSAYVISGVGSLTINSNGSYSFTPDANWNGDVPQISYTLSDGSSTNDSTLDIEVTAQDDSFTDANETVQIAEDSGEHTGTLLTGTSSVDGPVTVQSFSIAGETGTFTLGSAYVISGVGSLTINSNGSYSFTPDANWNGDVPQISYTLSDGSSTNDSTLDIEVTAQDDSFTDANETVQIAEDSGEHTGTLLTGTSSVDGPVTVQSFSIAGETGTFTLGSAYVISGVGSLTINSNGSYSFTPDANWNGDVPQISYTLSDGSSTNDSTLDIEVTAQDDSFTDANETVQIAEDSGEHTGTLLTGTSSVDGPVTVQSFSIAGETGTFTLGSAYVISGVGSLTINSNGSYSFTPDANWNGDVPQISYTLSDGSSTNDSTLDIEVTAQDDSFTDANETVQIAEDSGEHTGTLLTGTSSVDGPVTVQSFSIAGETGTFTLGSAYVISGVGSLTINSNGSYSFTPDANWNGDVPQISYTLSDGSSTNDSTLDIEVTAQDDSFTDANETVQIAEDSGEHTGTLLTGTSSVDGPVTVQSFSIAGETGTFTLGSAYVISGVGSLTINSNGSYSFTPDANWNGDVPQISYTLSDGSSTNDSTLDIEVTAQDDSFTDANETVQIAEDSGEHTGTLLTGTSSVDGPVTVQSFSIAGETGTFTLGSAYVISGVGSLTINSNGSYSFTPDANWNGDVPQISYTLSDGSSTNDSTLDIEVTAQDDSFTDANETVQIAEDSGEHTGTLLTGTSSVDGPVTVQSFSIAGETGTFTLGSAYVISGVGSLTINSNGSYSFTPDANWNGDVPQISYTLSDGSSTNDSTLDIEVTAQDDSFTDANETVQIAEDSGEHTGTLLTGTSSVDGPVTVQSFSIAGETGTFTLGSAYVISGVGSLTINSNGSYSFTPDANWNGDVPQISYTLSDGSSTNDSTLDIEVTAQDDSFTDANETVQIAEDSGEHTGTLLTGTSSVDGPVTVQSFSIAGETGTFTLGSAYVISGVGSLTINSNGSYSFTPDANWNGDVPQISYTLSDGSSTNDSTLDIEVTAQDDSFTDANETVQIAEDSGEHTGTLLTGTSSVDGPVTVQSFSIAGETGTFTLGSAYVISGVGSLTINSNGSYSFTPDANWNGDVPQISYTLSDGSSTNDSTLDIEVTAQDDSFTDANETVQIAEDSGEHTGTLLTGTSSVDGPVTVQSFSIAGETGTFTLGSAYVISGVGSLTINSNGSYSFTPDANWNGDVPQISYTLSDGSSTNDSTLDIEVTAQDDSFTDANETVQIAEDSGEHTGTLLTGTSSVDGPVTVQSFSIAGETGTFTLGRDRKSVV